MELRKESPPKISYIGQKRQASQNISGDRALKALNKSLFGQSTVYKRHCKLEAVVYLILSVSWALHTHKELLPPLLSPPTAHELFLLQINSFFKEKGSHETTGQCPLSCLSPAPGLLQPQSSEAVDEGTSHQLPYGVKATRGSRCVCMVHTSIHLPFLTRCPLGREREQKGREAHREAARDITQLPPVNAAVAPLTSVFPVSRIALGFQLCNSAENGLLESPGIFM